MNKKLYLFFLAVSLIICSYSAKELERVIDYYENGSIKSKKVFDSKSDTLNFVFIEYFENGNVKRTGPMKDSIVHGAWEYFYDNGNLMQKGTYIIDDSLNNGKWTYYYKLTLIDIKGDTIKERDGWMCSVEWMAREKKNLHVCKDGYWEFFHENGQLESKGNYQNGWPTGRWEKYSSSGQITLVSSYKDKKALGEWKYWYPNGQLMKITSYKNGQEKIENFWLNSGKQTLKDGTGTIFEKKVNGDSLIIDYKNYIKDGRDLTYQVRIDYGNKYGLASEHYYLNGKPTGTWKHFGTFGYTYTERLSRTTEYENGEIDGYWINYYHGDTTEIHFFVKGKEHGNHKQIDENTGILWLIEQWIMGKRHGIRKYFDEQTGEKELFQYFYDDEMVGEEKFENGKMISQRIFDGDELKFNELKE